MAEKFSLKYLPPTKITKLKNDISSYAQNESESLYDTWERFKVFFEKMSTSRFADVVTNSDVLQWVESRNKADD